MILVLRQGASTLDSLPAPTDVIPPATLHTDTTCLYLKTTLISVEFNTPMPGMTPHPTQALPSSSPHPLPLGLHSPSHP